MASLMTDNAARDNALRNQAIETALFPTATFEIKTPLTFPMKQTWPQDSPEM